jgi:hypothetical protein
MKKRPGRHFLEPSQIHENAPVELVQAYIEAGCNQHELSRQLQVNDFYVNQLLRKGIEPSNPEIRAKLFIQTKPKRLRTETEKRISALAKETADSVVRHKPTKKEYDAVRKVRG